MREILYAEALVEALRHQLAKDDRVHLIGQYFLGLTPHRQMMARLRDDYPDRVYYPPIAELGYVGTAIGAAVAGLRPIVDIATASFIFQAFPQVVNEAANVHYMSGGQTSVPMVFHFNHGIRGGGAPQHSHSPQAMLWNTPGLENMAPSTPRDLKGLVNTAVRSDNPTAWIDHVLLFDSVGSVPEDDEFAIPFGEADVKREGTDVTLVASSWMVTKALEAAELLAADGVEAEVVDLRTLVPLDEETILESVARTGRLVVVDECHRRCGVAAEIVSVVAENVCDELESAPVRVTAADVPIPFSPPLEQHVGPTTAKIVAAVESITGVGSGA